MAKKETQTETAQTSQASVMAMPEGFRRRTSVSDAPWFHMETGNVLNGRLLGRFVMNTEPVRAYYQVELAKACKVRVGQGDDAEVVEAAVGSVVNLSEMAKLKYLKDKEIPEILAGAEYDIWAGVGDKIKLKAGRTMWSVDSGTRQIKAAKGEVRPLPPDVSQVFEAEEGDGF